MEKREKGGLRIVLSIQLGFIVQGADPCETTSQAVMPTGFNSVWQWEALMGGWRVGGGKMPAYFCPHSVPKVELSPTVSASPLL